MSHLFHPVMPVLTQYSILIQVPDTYAYNYAGGSTCPALVHAPPTLQREVSTSSTWDGGSVEAGFWGSPGARGRGGKRAKKRRKKREKKGEGGKRGEKKKRKVEK
jgi:hypothetical protein